MCVCVCVRERERESTYIQFIPGYTNLCELCCMWCVVCDIIRARSATHCNTAATHCNTLQPPQRTEPNCNAFSGFIRARSAAHCNTLHNTRRCHPRAQCHTLQHIATCCKTLHHAAAHSNAFSHFIRARSATHWHTMNEPWLKYEWVMSHTKHEWVMSHTQDLSSHHLQSTHPAHGGDQIANIWISRSIRFLGRSFVRLFTSNPDWNVEDSKRCWGLQMLRTPKGVWYVRGL